MANVQVAVRVRPLNERETKEGGRIIVEVDDKVAKIRNLKVDDRPDSFGDSREKVVAFSFDYCYWSVNPEDPQYASQDVVFQDLGTEVLSGAARGYNICLFAYGQTGSGKTYTMLGTPASVGLTPRICEGLFTKEEDSASLPSSCRIKISFLEIYNERVRDLLKQSNQKKSYTLRVREHPEMGPYVEGLSQHVVTNYKQVIQLLEEGIANRITAATHVHEASSRSHAIFTIHYTQAILENNLPSEIASKINLVDLAGSEKADPSYCKDRITEGANINKSLVTLGIVISTLAQNSQVFSSCQSLKSTANTGGDSGILVSPGTSSRGGSSQRQSYIPYRDSVLTWLLKDSLGGNSKTIMVATVSPAHTSYSETMSTLRYASNAKNIINKPRVNEDANVKLIRELREEIERLKAMLLSFELRNFSSLNDEKDENLKELILRNELKIDKLTKEWTQKWNDWQALLEHYSVDINKRRAGVVIDCSLPHLMDLEDDVLSTGVVLYYLKEGITKIGRIDSDQEQDIVLQGPLIERDHCTITNTCGVVILRPAQGACCTVNGREVTASCRLTQGALITLGKAQKFRFYHPAEAAILRQQRQVGKTFGGSGSLEWLDLDGDVTASRLSLYPLLWKERRVLEEQYDEDHQPLRDGERSHRAQIQQQQCCVEALRQRILAGQISAERELAFNQAYISQETKDNQQWLLREESWLYSLQEQQQQEDCGTGKALEASLAPNAWLQTHPDTPPSSLVPKQKRLVQLQLLRRHALRAAEGNIWRKKVLFQLDRIIRKQRLLESQKRLEQLRALCWFQDDSRHKSPCLAPNSNATVPGPQHRSKWTSCSSLSLQRLYSQHLPHLHRVFLNWDLSTMLPPMPDPTHHISEKNPSEYHFPQTAAYPPNTGCLCKNGLHSPGQAQLYTARGALTRKGASTPHTCLTVSSESVDIQETKRVGKWPYWMVSRGLTSLCQSTNKLKPREGPKILTPISQTRKAKGLVDSSSSTQAGWQKEENLGIHEAAKGTSCSFSYPHGLREAARLGKIAKTFQAESKPPPNRALQQHQRVPAARIRDIAKKSSHLSNSSPLKRQCSVDDPDTMTSLTDSSPIVDCAREKENDLSDTDSSYSVDSLSFVYAKSSLLKLLKPEDPRGKWDHPEPENSESDNSQISEDSLTEKGYQSPKESPQSSLPTNDHVHPRNRAGSTVQDFTTSSDCGLLAHRSFSLDSLINAEKELGEDQQGVTFLDSSDEMPTETFWHLQNPILPIVDQEVTCRHGSTYHRTGAMLNAILPMNSSFYLNPELQLHCKQPESQVEVSYSEPTDSLQGIQVSRGSPLVSMDSWFSCDSKINPSSLCPSPDVQEVQPCGEERPGYWLNIGKLKPLGTETVLQCSSKFPQGSTELPCNARDVYPTSTSDTSKLSLWEAQSFLQPAADGSFQGISITDTTQQGSSEVSHDSSVPTVLAPSATSFIYVGSTHERDWAALQQKYLLELSHPVLEAVGKPRLAFPCPEEDSSSLAEASGKGKDTRLSVGSGLSTSSDFNNFPIHLSKIKHLRAEKKQDSLRAKLEIASDFLSTSEKEVSCNGAYSADLESLASGSEKKIQNSMKKTCEIKQNNLKESFNSRKPGLITSSEEYFLQNNAYHNNITVSTKTDHWPQGQAPLRNNSTIHPEQLSQNSHHHLQKEKVDCQKSSKEVVERYTNVSFAFPSGPELYLHSAPWNPFPSSLQPPPLETFYITKSRDALTETALEIPAYREVHVPSPPPREAWGFGYNHQDLQEACLKNDLPVIFQNSKVAPSQQVTAEMPVDLKTREAIGELGKCAGNIKEESHNSVYVFVTQNRHFLPSTSTKVYESKNQIEILSKKHNLPALKEGKKATVQSHCSVSSGSSVSGKPFFFVGGSETGGEDEQNQNALLQQIQVCDINRQIPSGARSDFICKTTSVDLEKDVAGETTVSSKFRSVHHRVSSHILMAQDESLTHKWEGRNEIGLLGKALHPKNIPEEFKLPGIESTYERFQSDTYAQERKPSECKGPGESQEISNYKEEPLGKKKNERISNADEMARLIRSVMQLENDILEIESKQLHASSTPGISKEFVFQDQRDQESDDHVLRPGSSGNNLSFKDQPSSPRQADGIIFNDSETREMEVNSPTVDDPQAQRITLSPFSSRECVKESQSVREHTYLAGLDRPARNTCDSLGKDSTHRESTNTSLHPRRMKTLTRALSLQPRPERFEKGDELVDASANPKEQPWNLGNLEELETMKGFLESQIARHQSSSKPDRPKAQGKIEEMAMQKEGSLQNENNMVLSTQKHPSSSQHSMGTFFNQETIFPLLSQTDFSTAPSHQDLSNTLPLHSPRLPRSYIHSFVTEEGISSFEYVLNPTVLKIHNSPLITEIDYQNQSGEIRSHSPQGNDRGGSAMEHSAWCGSVIHRAMGSHGQSSAPENTPPGTEDRITASTSPQHQQGELRITLMGLSTQEGFGSEVEAAIQKEIRASSLNSISRQFEKRVSFSLEENSDQGKGARQKAEKESEDPGFPTSGACLAPVSLPRVADPEPRQSEHSVPISMCLAILEEVRQAKAQRKQLNDFVAGGTVLPRYETSLEPECSSGATGRQCKQMDQLVSDGIRNEGEAQALHVASLSATPRHLLTDEGKSQAIPLCENSFPFLPNTETNRGPQHPSQASSHVAPALDKGHCTRELRHVLGASEQFICHSGSPEITEKKKEAPRTPSYADPLAFSGLFSPAVEGDRRVGSEKAVSAFSSQAPCDDPGLILHEQSQSASGETAEDMSSGIQDSSPEQELKTQGTTYEGGLDNCSVSAQEKKAAHFESQSVICNVHNSLSCLGPKQDYVQCPEVSNGSEEGKTSPKLHAVLPGGLRSIELEAPTQQPEKWKGNVGSGLAETCRFGSINPRPTPLQDQRPCRCPEETRDPLVFSGNTENSRTLSSSREEEESRTVPCQQLCNSQPIATHASPSHCSISLVYRDGDLEKGIPKAALHPIHPPFIVASRVCEMHQIGESSSKESHVLLAHGLEPKGFHMELGPIDSPSFEPSTRTSVLSLAQSSSSLSTPDIRTSSLIYSAAEGSSRSIGNQEEKLAEKASPEVEVVSFPAAMYSEPLRNLKDSSVCGHNVQASQMKPEPLATTHRPHTLNLNESSVESELVVVEPQLKCLRKTIRCLSEKLQSSAESRDHNCSNPPAKLVTRLKPICYPQIDSLWEEEEQQKDQALGGSEDSIQVRNSPPSNEGDLDSCHTSSARREEMSVPKTPASQTSLSAFEDLAFAPLEQSKVSQSAAQRPSQHCFDKEQLAPHCKCSLPVIAVFSGPKHSKSCPRPQFSVVSSSRSLQELNLSVEPPSPIDEDASGPNILWDPHLKTYSLENQVSRMSTKAEVCSQKVSSNLDNGHADHRPPKPATPPYPTSSTRSCMPTPDLMTGWMSSLEQAQQGKPEKLGIQIRPENWYSQMDKEMLHFGSSDINPYLLPWCPEEPVHIGWKQYVFGSTVDVSCTQKPHGLIPSNVARCSSMDSDLEEQSSPFHSHLSTFAKTQDLSSTHSSTDNIQGSNEAWEVCSSLFPLRDSHILTGHKGLAPILGSDKKTQFKGTVDEAGCLRSEHTLPSAEGSSAGLLDEIVLLYPPAADCPVGLTRTNTFEQGTQTLGCRLPWSCANISSAQPDASTGSACDLTSWTSMHNLSLHLSQLLHNTSELLGSLSQPSVAKKEQSTRRNTPDEAPQALMMDGTTQTTVDEEIQTDLALSPLDLQTSKAKSQEVSVILEVLGSDVSAMSQQKGDIPGTLQSTEAEETSWKMAAPPDLHEESTHHRLQSPLIPLSHKREVLSNLPSISPPASPNASLPPSSQPEESSCMVVNSPNCSICLTPGLFPSTSGGSNQEPEVQEKLSPGSALMVDRASSPILTFSASTQESGLLSGALILSAPSDYALESHQELDSSPDLVFGAPRPPMDNYSQTADKLGGSQRVETLGREGTSSLRRSNESLFLESNSPCTTQQSLRLQVSLLGKPPQQLQPRATTEVQSRLPPLPPWDKSQRLASSFVPEKVASPEHSLLSTRGPSPWQSNPENEGENSILPVEPQPTLNLASSRRSLQHFSPHPVSELTDTASLQGCNVDQPQACQPEGMPCPSSQACIAPQRCSLRDLLVHNKLSNWDGVQNDFFGELSISKELGAITDLSPGEQIQKPPQPPDDQSQDPEWSQREQIPLQVGAQKPSLSLELTEAKLHHGFGEADALLQVLQSGTGETLVPEERMMSTWEELYARQKKAIETLRRERTERLQNFLRTRSPPKQLSLLPSRDLLTQNFDLPSRRREYLQQLRKDVVEITRSPESASRSAPSPSDIDLMLRNYQRAREEAKTEIAKARDRLREQTEQEKLRIREQIISHLLREEERLHTLANSSSLCTSSNGSLSSVVTSGYNSSPALSGQLRSPESVGDSNLPDSRDTWIGDGQAHSAVRNLYLAGSVWKNSAHCYRTSSGNCRCFPSSPSSFSSSYQDLAKHMVDTSMADVMAACSNNLHNLFSRQATAGWNYQGEEQEVHLYYKEFSSTRHGFLGAGVVSQPLSHVWAAVSDPTLWPLYHKPIQTARLHQRVNKSISLVYLVCDTTVCALKQPRDFCCVCVEAKEVPALLVGHLSIMAVQSVYDTSMPRPNRKMVRGEILPSAWILQPVTMEGKEITRVIYLAQVELGAPGFPPHLLSSFIKQQPLVVARLASFLGS
ncbi:stAR-related lipid transfer protein 9 isoform X3 [Marmota marmota marmota]|uniref:stAR-related lipid transfer protein 9 isoform X3 n=1 Tax=Marmota marmota marmota TaxID=9994 RepID=UPI0020935ED7|nr:stAR-related lipid transfer protein 9 isoform X3 [Marmota marmota marmota]